MPAGEALAGRLIAFAGRVRNLRVRRAAGQAFAQAVLSGAVPAIVLLWMLPSSWPVVGGVLAAMAVLWTTRAVRSERRVAAAALLRDGGEQLAIVGDELATWLEWRPRTAGTNSSAGMVAWLGRTVDAELPQLPGDVLQAIGRRKLGRLRWLVPIVLLLLLAWLLLAWFQPPWPGVFGGKPEWQPPHAAGGSGSGTSPSPSGGASGEPSPGKLEPSPPPNSRPGGALPPPPQQQNPEPPPPPQPPAPMLDLPTQRHFVVPDHIDDGPTRRMRMHAAEVPEDEGTRAATQTSGAAGVPTPPPPSTLETFQRAAEAAQRARHVPPAEQPMVRRFFDLLQKAAR